MPTLRLGSILSIWIDNSELHQCRRCPAAESQLTLEGANFGQYDGITYSTEALMGSLTIPEIDADLKKRLKERAARHGLSVEAEAHDILRAELGREHKPPVPDNLADAIRAIVEPLGGVELEALPRRPIRTPPTFE